MTSERIAIIGSGISGLTCAYLLHKKYDITIFEKNNYVGGHTNTIEVTDNETQIPVDTGFIVMNHKNYPLFTELLKRLDVELQDSNMSFGHFDLNKYFYYNTDTIRGLFAQRKNLLSLKFYKLLWDIIRFFRIANKDLDSPTRMKKLNDYSLGKYLKELNLGQEFIDSYLIPMGSAIWSTPTDKMMDFPLKSFLHFYRNHGLLSVNEHPQWRTIKGGSYQYVKKILDKTKCPVHCNTPVESITRETKGVSIITKTGRKETFDKVIIATHADEAYKILSDPTEEEKNLLSTWRYSQNKTFLHTDISLLPPNTDAWASWNFCRGKNKDDLTLTYYMNKLQKLKTNKTYLVTLNPQQEINPTKEILEIDYTHPQFDFENVKKQKQLSKISKDRTFYCGSYHGYGFHEDGVRSAVDICKKLGVFFP